MKKDEHADCEKDKNVTHNAIPFWFAERRPSAATRSGV